MNYAHFEGSIGLIVSTCRWDGSEVEKVIYLRIKRRVSGWYWVIMRNRMLGGVYSWSQGMILRKSFLSQHNSGNLGQTQNCFHLMSYLEPLHCMIPGHAFPTKYNMSPWSCAVCWFVDMYLSIFLRSLQPLEGVINSHNHRSKAEAMILNTVCSILSPIRWG